MAKVGLSCWPACTVAHPQLTKALSRWTASVCVVAVYTALHSMYGYVSAFWERYITWSALLCLLQYPQPAVFLHRSVCYSVFCSVKYAWCIVDYVQCDYCGRRFNEAAAQRHIPWCKEKNERIPKKKPDQATAAQKMALRTGVSVVVCHW